MRQVRTYTVSEASEDGSGMSMTGRELLEDVEKQISEMKHMMCEITKHQYEEASNRYDLSETLTACGTCCPFQATIADLRKRMTILEQKYCALRQALQ